MTGAPDWLLAVLLIPTICVAIDTASAVRAGLRGRFRRIGEPVHDFTVLVPIYGNIRYLENVAFLRPYGARVVLCTTDKETPEFDRALRGLAYVYGFRLHRAAVSQAGQGEGKRATGGTTRDTIIRSASMEVRTRYVVCLDADTVTLDPLPVIVGELAARELDLASIRLVPSNTESWLGRLQAHEYRIGMKLRIVVPWLVSGACHVARTTAHQQVMARHSLFFQGNDVELGVLADALGLRVGHLPFDVPTTIPDRAKPWLRQRLAWSGGEFRLFAVNVHLALRHPFFWAYGLVVVIVGTPWRWLSLQHIGLTLIVTAVLYELALLAIERRHLDRWVLLMPLYSAFSSLILTPLGVLTYLKMSIAGRNAGFIRARRRLVTA